MERGLYSKAKSISFAALNFRVAVVSYKISEEDDADETHPLHIRNLALTILAGL